MILNNCYMCSRQLSTGDADGICSSCKRRRDGVSRQANMLNELVSTTEEYLTYESSDGKWNKREPLRKAMKYIIKEIRG